jgi:prepilin-type N-terminal cleavage/methylation domain-containing protein
MSSNARARLSRRARACAACEDGFTLPELLVVMAILLVVVASLASVLVSASRTEVDESTRFQAQAQARAGLYQLERELHCAGSVTQTNGSSLTAGTSYSAITVQLGSTCPTNVTHATTFYVTYCTAASTQTTGDYTLYRVTSTSTRPTCSSSGKVAWADYLQPTTGVTPTWSYPFCLPDATNACGGVLKPATSLPMLHVTMAVNVNGPTTTRGRYNLVADIAFRNGTRT